VNESRFGLRPPTRPASHGPPDVLRILWTQPRASVRWLLDHGGLRLSILLVCGACVTAVVASEASLAPFASMGAWSWVLGLSLGTAIGLFHWTLAAAFLTLVGRALGGVTTWTELLIALAWGGAPVAACLPFALLLLWSRSLGSTSSVLLSHAFLFVLYGWAVATTTLAVSEANRFSFARGILCMVALLGFVAAEISALWFLLPQFSAR